MEPRIQYAKTKDGCARTGLTVVPVSVSYE
jgi:hypothetical protein